MAVDDLRFVSELARTGRLVDVASRTGVDSTTVSRRISRLEAELGVRLFDRNATRWHLTDAGQRALPFVETVDAAVAALYEDVQSPTGELTGSVRVLAPDGFGSYVLAPALGVLRAHHPKMIVELSTATTHDVLTGRDFDVAVALERPSTPAVAVADLAEYELRLYASREYLARVGTPSSVHDLHDHTVIWYIESLLDVAPLRIIDQMLPGVRAGVQTNNIAAQHRAALGGVGIAPLPSYVGESDTGLVQVLPTFRQRRSLYLIVPRDLMHLPRVDVVLRLLRDVSYHAAELWEHRPG